MAPLQRGTVTMRISLATETDWVRAGAARRGRTVPRTILWTLVARGQICCWGAQSTPRRHLTAPPDQPPHHNTEESYRTWGSRVTPSENTIDLYHQKLAGSNYKFLKYYNEIHKNTQLS